MSVGLENRPEVPPGYTPRKSPKAPTPQLLTMPEVPPGYAPKKRLTGAASAELPRPPQSGPGRAEASAKPTGESRARANFRATLPEDLDLEKVNRGVEAGEIPVGLRFVGEDGNAYEVFASPKTVEEAKGAWKYQMPYMPIPVSAPEGAPKALKALFPKRKAIPGLQDILTGGYISDEWRKAQEHLQEVERNNGYVRRMTEEAEEIAGEEQAYLRQARERLDESATPNLETTAMGLGGTVVSLAQRLTLQNEEADDTLRVANAFRQAAAERDAQGRVPAFLKRGMRGVGESLPPMLLGGGLGGAYGAIIPAVGIELNSAIQEGKDAGLDGLDLANYVVGEGVIEAAPAILFQKMGLGGVEKLFGGQAGAEVAEFSIKSALKQAGVTALEELPEELITEIGHNLQKKMAGVDPNAMSRESLAQTVLDTTTQTLMTVGVMEAPRVTLSAMHSPEVADEMLEKYLAGESPSRKDSARWGAPAEARTSQGTRSAWLEGEVTKAVAMGVEPPPVQQPAAVAPPEPPPVQVTQIEGAGTDAQQEQEAAQVHAGGSARMEAEVRQGTEPGGREGVRPGGQASRPVSEAAKEEAVRRPYEFMAIGETGYRVGGVYEAESREDMIAELLSWGYTPTKIRNPGALLWKRVSESELNAAGSAVEAKMQAREAELLEEERRRKKEEAAEVAVIEEEAPAEPKAQPAVTEEQKKKGETVAQIAARNAVEKGQNISESLRIAGISIKTDPEEYRRVRARAAELADEMRAEKQAAKPDLEALAEQAARGEIDRNEVPEGVYPPRWNAMVKQKERQQAEAAPPAASELLQAYQRAEQLRAKAEEAESDSEADRLIDEAVLEEESYAKGLCTRTQKPVASLLAKHVPSKGMKGFAEENAEKHAAFVLRDVFSIMPGGANFYMLAEHGTRAIADRDATVEKLAKSLYHSWAREQGLAADSLLGPASGLTDKGKREVVESFGDLANDIYDAVTGEIQAIHGARKLAPPVEAAAQPAPVPTTQPPPVKTPPPVPEPPKPAPPVEEPEGVWQGKNDLQWAAPALAEAASKLGIKTRGKAKRRIIAEAREVEANIREYADWQGVKEPQLRNALDEVFPSMREAAEEVRRVQDLTVEATGLSFRDIAWVANNNMDYESGPKLKRSTRKKEREIGRQLTGETSSFAAVVGDVIQHEAPGVLEGRDDIERTQALWDLMQRGPIEVPRMDSNDVLEAAKEYAKNTFKAEEFYKPERLAKEEITEEAIEEANAKLQDVEDIPVEDVMAIEAEEIERQLAAEPTYEPRAPRLRSKLPRAKAAAARQEAIDSLKEDLGGAIANLNSILAKAGRGETPTVGGLNKEILDGLVQVVKGAAIASAKTGKAAYLTFAEFMASLPPHVQAYEKELADVWEKIRTTTRGHRLAPHPDAVTPKPGKKPPIKKKGEPKPEVTPEDDLAGTKHAVSDLIREKYGMRPRRESERQFVDDWLDEAEGILRRDKDAGRALVDELTARTRTIENVENMTLLLHQRQLLNQLNEVLAERRKEPAGSTTYAALDARARDISTELTRILDVADAGGTAWGRAGVARQQLMLADHSLVHLKAMAEKSKGGSLTPDELDMIAKTAETLEGLRKRVEAVEVKYAIDAAMKAAAPRRESGTRRATPDERVDAAKARVRDALAKYREVGFAYDPAGRASKHLELQAALAELAKAYVAKGVYSLAGFTSSVKEEFGEDAPDDLDFYREAWGEAKGERPDSKRSIDKSKPHTITRRAREILRGVVASMGIADPSGVTEALREEAVARVHEDMSDLMGDDWTETQTRHALAGVGLFRELPKDLVSVQTRDVVGQLQKLTQLDELRADRSAPKFGSENRTPSDLERDIQKEVNEEKKAYEKRMKAAGRFTDPDPAKSLKTALGAAKTRIRNQIRDMNKEIADKKRIVKKRTELVPDPELENLIEQRDALKKEWDKTFKLPLTDEQKAERLVRTLNNLADRMEEKLKRGEIWGKKPEMITSPEVDLARARIARLRALREVMQDKDDPNRAWRADLTRRLVKLRERRATGDYARAIKKDRVLSQEEKDLRWEYAQEFAKFKAEQEEWERARRTTFEKVIGVVPDALNASRSQITSFDLSGLLRQGGAIAFIDPKIAWDAAKPMWAAFKSEKAEHDIAEEQRARGITEFAERCGLAITVTEGALRRQEESYMGRWMKQVPKWAEATPGKEFSSPGRALGAPFRLAARLDVKGVAASERAYVTVLNEMRLKKFEAMVDALGGPNGVTDAEGKVIANFVNVFTGRGPLDTPFGSLEAAAVPLATIFFSPRYVMSRLQMLSTQPFWTTRVGWKAGWRARKQVAWEYAKLLRGLTMFYGSIALAAAAFYDDDDPDKPRMEFDPRSGAFLKVRFGNTTLDPAMGLAQVGTLLGRLTTGQTKRISGEVVDIRGEDVPYGGMTARSALHEFADRKLSPAFSTALALVSGETAMHKPLTPVTLVSENTVPLAVRDVYQVLQDQGMSKGAALSILAIFGMGVNVWEPRKKKKTAKKKKVKLYSR